MAARRAEVISVNDLSKAIDKAVSLAMKRNKIKADIPNLAVSWEIIGRRLRDLKDPDSAFRFANDVTKNVRVRGIKADPAVLRVGRNILVGFIERSQLPRE